MLLTEVVDKLNDSYKSNMSKGKFNQATLFVLLIWHVASNYLFHTYPCSFNKFLYFSVESENHVMLLIELLPDWLQIVKVQKGKFLKMNKNQDLNIIKTKLTKMYDEAKYQLIK